MSTITQHTITNLLGDPRLVRDSLPTDIAALPKNAKIVYGETYDSYGITLDSLKYYFVVALLQELSEGASSTIIIGDLHSVMNKIVDNKDGLLQDAAARIAFIEAVNKTYKLKLQPQLMSTLFESKEFADRLAHITPLFQQSAEMQAIAKRTVLANRLAQEEASGFRYTLEEVALISDYDVKVGPPREMHYDQLTQLLGKPDFTAIHLTPTYPLAMGIDYYLNSPEAEEFGVTPYKAGSNKLQTQRIILGATSLTKAKELIDASFVAPNPKLPNPVRDIYIISQLAAHFLNSKPFTLDEAVLADATKLKSAAYTGLRDTIYKPLELPL